jgi:acetoin utilization protein AcuB
LGPARKILAAGAFRLRRHLARGMQSSPGRKETAMRLREIMSENPVSIRPDAPAAEARAAMRTAGVHHLIVLDGKTVAGLLSERDVRNASGDLPVSSLMATRLATATPGTTVREAANILRGRSVGSLPILDRGRVVGIVTISDLLTLIGRGAERPIAVSTRWTLRKRGPRRRPPQPSAPGARG